MTLPASRNTTYTSGSPVKSADLNAIQDAIIGQKHGDVVMTIHPSLFTITTGGAYNANGYVATSASGTMRCAVPMLEGSRIKEVVFSRYGDGAADITAMNVQIYDSIGSLPTAIGSGTVTNPPASWADTTIGVTEHQLAAGEALQIEFAWNASGIRIGNVRITYDRP